VLAAVAGFVPFSLFITSDGKELETSVNIVFSVAPVLFALTGILIAWRLYKSENEVPAKLARAFGSFYQGAFHKFYIDEVYLFITKKVIFNLVGRPSAWIDKNIVDGGVNLSADLTEDTSGLIRNWQSGNLQQYAMWFFAAVIGLVMIFMSAWK
jgi:NADH-quinone oxidoreductase subunit L